MEKFNTVARYQACDIIGGGKSPEENVVRLFGRLVGAATKALYDLITGKLRKPQAAASW